jgi:hypothetical protein
MKATKIVFSILIVAISAFVIFKLRPSVKNSPVPAVTPTVSESSTSGKLAVIVGSAQLATAFGTQAVSTVSAVEISDGDTVVTQADSVAVVDFGQGTLIRVGPDTSFTVSQNKLSLNLKQVIGSLYMRFKKISGVRETLEVATPTTVAVVRGTKFGVFWDISKSKVAVTENTVELFKKLPSGEIDRAQSISIPTSGEGVLPSSNGPLILQNQQLSISERAWLDFNGLADSLYDRGITDTQSLTDLAANYMNQSRIAPTPTPSISPSPTFTSAPKASAVLVVAQMFGTGYSSGTVNTDVGSFLLSCIGASKGSTRVITDSASETDCKKDCPVKSLSEYVSGNGGFAGLNGMYFCPPDYASCQDKKNSFDTLFFNSRVKRYINSDNNIYSVIPFLAVNADGSPRFLAHSSEWGRDTGIMAGTAGNPQLIRNGQNVTGEYSLDDKQQNTKSNRGAFVEKGSTEYLCIVSGATVPDSAQVYKSLQVENAINIDGGGSSALYVNGTYKFGPGRALPTAIIFAGR